MRPAMKLWLKAFFATLAAGFLAWTAVLALPLLQAPNWRDRLPAVLGLLAILWLSFRLFRFLDRELRRNKSSRTQ